MLRIFRWIFTNRVALLFLFAVAGSPAAGSQKKDTAFLGTQLREGRRLLLESRWDSAQKLFSFVYEESQHMGYYDGIMLSLCGIGSSIAAKGDSYAALDWYRKGFSLYKIHKGSSLAILLLYGGMAERNAELARYDSCYFYNISGLTEVMDRFPDDNYAQTGFFLNLSSYWLNKSEPFKALYYVEKSIKASEKLPKDDSYGMLISGIYNNKAGILFHCLHKKDSAIQCLKIVINYGDSNNRISAVAWQNLANIHLDSRDYTQAIFCYKKALFIRDNLRDFRGMANTQQYLGAAYLGLNRYREAEYYLTEAAKGFRKNSLNFRYLNVLGLLSDLYARQGRYRDAYSHLSEAYGKKDSILSEQSTKNINELDIKYKTAEKDRKITLNALEINRQQSAIKEKNLLIGGVSLSAIFLAAFLMAARRSYRNRRRIFDKQMLVLQQEKELETLKGMMRGEEQERTRLARELHDGVGSMLAVIKMNVSVLQQEPDTENKSRGWQEVMGLVEDTADEVRKAAHNLMPEILSKHSLPAALRMYCDSLNTGKELVVDLHFHSEWKALDATFELSLYRILQELIQNIVKHAHAHHAVIQFREDKDVLYIMVEDDGIGFDHAVKVSGLGLQNIRSRVATLGGMVSIESMPGKGTSSSLELPLVYAKQ